jgi:hypothetical protein
MICIIANFVRITPLLSLTFSPLLLYHPCALCPSSSPHSTPPSIDSSPPSPCHHYLFPYPTFSITHSLFLFFISLNFFLLLILLPPPPTSSSLALFFLPHSFFPFPSLSSSYLIFPWNPLSPCVSASHPF